jgi:diadenosine tetraphosphate (Ap4A) HIT family hydrolase
LVEHDYCQGADFCHEIAGDGDVSFTRTYMGNPTSRRIVTTDLFVLVADLSPLVVGHLLLLPKRHHLSFSEVIQDACAELLALLDWLRPRYAATFGTLSILEHGSSIEVDQRACITHAHWHLLPVAAEAIHQTMIEDGLMSVDLATVKDLADHQWTGSSYFLLSHAGRHRVYRPVANLRRQYLRSVAGRVVGMSDPEWDYAVIVRTDYLRTTMKLVRDWCYPDCAGDGQDE